MGSTFVLELVPAWTKVPRLAMRWVTTPSNGAVIFRGNRKGPDRAAVSQGTDGRIVLALGEAERFDLRRFDLRFGGEIFALRVVDFLLGYEAGLGFRRTLSEAIELEMEDTLCCASTRLSSCWAWVI